MSELMPFIDETFRIPRHGEIVKGTVFQVDDDKVYLNIGSNKEGLIPKEEIALEPGQDIKSQFQIGQELEAKVLKNDDGEGFILLSRKKIEVSEHWDEITKAHEDNEVIEVKVIREVKGGVIAAYKEVHGFIPMSQLNDRYVEKADEFIGQTMMVRVTKVDTRRSKAVFSHKVYLAEEKSKKIKEIWESIHVGDIIEGTVMRFTDYGAFVDIGGIDGLLHISEISWGKLRHPQEALEIGQKIKVKILSMNEEKGKISLGLKQNTPEPWSVIGENYKVGQIVEGKVVQIKEYGAFVELEPGLDGLVHISEIAAKRVSNINDELSVGQMVSAKILEIDEAKRRISLSIKETLGSEETEAEPVPQTEQEAEGSLGSDDSQDGGTTEPEEAEIAETQDAPADEETEEPAENTSEE
jgi:4-hydroxy-3-methylbut-2-enyl diphosphate reductase